MASGQKGSSEVKHKEVRYICPKETDLYGIDEIEKDKVVLKPYLLKKTWIKYLPDI